MGRDSIPLELEGWSLHDLLEVVAKKAHQQRWSLEKLQDELYGYYEEAPCESSPSTRT